MSRTPEFISLDVVLPDESLPDFYAADAALPRQVERLQHALMHGWGGPPTAMSIYSNDGGVGGRTSHVLLRVPPYCQWMRWAALGHGEGAVLLTTADDTNGTLIGWRFSHMETALWVPGTNETGTALDATGRALKVSATLQANWQTVQVQVLLTGGGVPGGLRGLAFYPLLFTT